MQWRKDLQSLPRSLASVLLFWGLRAAWGSVPGSLSALLASLFLDFWGTVCRPLQELGVTRPLLQVLCHHLCPLDLLGPFLQGCVRSP